ncbi:MAG: bifunctional diaminohydroxyphosphoribosylaminopyrimidine deaminase/5-amino-6-(5-phosphoribosylamino)uracil reductase RibD [Flavobacteriales bacterium]
MADHRSWMSRCLRTARNGAGLVAPNPMVGAVLVKDDRILAEGWHRTFGGPHAEVECLQAFGPGPIPEDAALYVNLEPCAHHGKTPPCADLIVARGIRRVVIGGIDPFAQVAGKGIERMRAAGVEVIVPVEAEHCRWQQRRFLTHVEQARPYIILKWAQSADGYLDQYPRRGRAVQRISSATTDVLVHTWRSEEAAILVGSRTVVNDDPQLTVRHVEGRTPLRVVIDRRGLVPRASRIFDGSAPTLLIGSRERSDVEVEQFVLSSDEDPIDACLVALHARSITSLIVEGGAELLGRFIDRDVWDEARVIRGTPVLTRGTPAPTLHTSPVRIWRSGSDHIALHVNPASPSAGGRTPSAEWDW